MVTRRQIISVSLAGIASAERPDESLILPVHLMLDTRARFQGPELRYFQTVIWPEAMRQFGWCRIHFGDTLKTGEIKRAASGRPVIIGLEPGAINVVITDQIPIEWDRGRGVAGVTTLYEGRHVCIVALRYAHGNQIPFLSVNTCVHELLHVLLQDIFEKRPRGLTGEAREMRVDWYATRLWLFHDGAEVRTAANSYVTRLRSGGHGATTAVS